MRRYLFLFLAILGTVSLPVPAEAQQAQTSTIRGSLLDPMAAPLAGAQVQAWHAAAVVSTTLTDAQGRFQLTLAPGAYRLSFSSPGFLDRTEDINLSMTPVALAPRVLQLAGLHEDITVTASVGTADTRSATKTATRLLDVPQSITVVGRTVMADQMMVSMGDVMRYVPGVSVHQGENNRDQVVIRGNSSSADFFVDGVRDDVQYFRDVYNLDKVETLKGPNAMVFGRGGAGGVVNRVSRTAGFAPSREVTLQTGSFGYRRMTAGANQPLGQTLALRVDGMFEDSDTFRAPVGLQRYGVTPTLTYTPSADTRATVRYEFLHDTRVADRGIASFQGLPAEVPIRTYYGNADDSFVRADAHLASGLVEHRRGRATFRNQILIADYGRSYQNYVPGAATPDKVSVSISAYNNDTGRRNVFNQTDMIVSGQTGRVQHTVLSGVEFGRQNTDNLRRTGFFGSTATSTLVPFFTPRVATPATFRPSATDADNHVTTSVAAAYAQDQMVVSPHLEIVAGLRVDRFDLNFQNHRTSETLSRPDTLVSPRAGLVVKPRRNLSIYGSHSVTSLPSSGDQFASLTNITTQLKPERFRNYEAGAKWDPVRSFSLTAAVYRLDRTNTRSTDPQDPTRIVQTGSQRTTGFEVGANGRVRDWWAVTGGYASQKARVTSATAAAALGREVGQVPRQTLSLWNQVRLHARLSAAAGIVARTDMFAAVDNTVRLPGYARLDAAAFVTLTPELRLQVNVENALDARYFINADSNTNISPGAPRGVRVGLTATF